MKKGLTVFSYNLLSGISYCTKYEDHIFKGSIKSNADLNNVREADTVLEVPVIVFDFNSYGA